MHADVLVFKLLLLITCLHFNISQVFFRIRFLCRRSPWPLSHSPLQQYWILPLCPPLPPLLLLSSSCFITTPHYYWRVDTVGEIWVTVLTSVWFPSRTTASCWPLADGGMEERLRKRARETQRWGESFVWIIKKNLWKGGRKEKGQRSTGKRNEEPEFGRDTQK